MHANSLMIHLLWISWWFFFHIIITLLLYGRTNHSPWEWSWHELLWPKESRSHCTRRWSIIIIIVHRRWSKWWPESWFIPMIWISIVHWWHWVRLHIWLRHIWLGHLNYLLINEERHDKLTLKWTIFSSFIYRHNDDLRLIVVVMAIMVMIAGIWIMCRSNWMLMSL